MELTLTRIEKHRGYTAGHLDVDGVYYCDTLEPTWRNIGPGRPGRKVLWRTAIPEGRYPLVVTLSPRFGKWLPLLLHVPLFEGVRIHAGNTVKDTVGCILVGRRIGPGVLADSGICLRRLKALLAGRPEGEGVWLTVK